MAPKLGSHHRNPRQPRSPAERFWSRVDKNGSIAPGMDTPCWLRTAGLTGPRGYSQFWLGRIGGRDGPNHSVSAARWVYEQEHGPIPMGLEPDHRCRTRLCVRLDHLELVTRAENQRRAHAWPYKGGFEFLTAGLISCHTWVGYELG